MSRTPNWRNTTLASTPSPCTTLRNRFAPAWGKVVVVVVVVVDVDVDVVDVADVVTAVVVSFASTACDAGRATINLASNWAFHIVSCFSHIERRLCFSPSSCRGERRVRSSSRLTQPTHAHTHTQHQSIHETKRIYYARRRARSTLRLRCCVIRARTSRRQTPFVVVVVVVVCGGGCTSIDTRRRASSSATLIFFLKKKWKKKEIIVIVAFRRMLFKKNYLQPSVCRCRRCHYCRHARRLDALSSSQRKTVLARASAALQIWWRSLSQ